jgi:hypothetical protein
MHRTSPFPTFHCQRDDLERIYFPYFSTALVIEGTAVARSCGFMIGRKETFALNARNQGSATAGICDVSFMSNTMDRPLTVVVRKKIGRFRFEISQNSFDSRTQGSSLGGCISGFHGTRYPSESAAKAGATRLQTKNERRLRTAFAYLRPEDWVRLAICAPRL